MELPKLPCSFESLPAHLQKASSRTAITEATEPFKIYESKLRQIYAQEPAHRVVSQNHLVPVYQEGKADLTIRARDLASEGKVEQEKYLLPLPEAKRRKEGSNAITSTLKDFRYNFTLFSESSLADLKWDNVVAAGSSVVTALLPVDAPHNESKRALRSFYHETLAPASDVDLFLYGLNEEQAVEKIKQIEASVRDAILSETTVVRTKNAITIVSEYPTRHIQIVLRVYKSISEILTGFDVDCACVAYDGKQVWAAPRALAAFATQLNSIDLTRRSPSYENRLSKYSHRGFEVYWPSLDRSKVDPTIYERAFNRVLGLARLLVLEKLPHPQDRDEYLTKRREERGRPELPWQTRYRHQLPGNIKDTQPDDVAEWYAEDDISNYHTFTIPYGPRYTPKKIERLLFSKDLLLNAEFNKPKDRETNLHRHPAFFGRVEDVIHDCCGYCPKPETDADLAAYEEESKTFISGDISFLKDDPGRQEIGSFNPLTNDDWTEMAYIGNTTRLCQAIVDGDLEGVKDWFAGEEADVNARDHTGRTPLHLAVICSTPEIVQCLIDHGARLVARLYNGLTALHLASHRGDAAMVKLLLDKSNENAIEEDKKEETRKAARRAAAGTGKLDDKDVRMTQPDEDEDIDRIDSDDAMDEDSPANDVMTEGSFVKVEDGGEPSPEDDKDDDPDVYNVDVVAWDSPVSALHLAIMGGHQDVINLLVDKYGADVMLPVKIMNDDTPRTAQAAILTLLLPLSLPLRQAHATIKTLLDKNASPLQANMKGVTAMHAIIYEAKTEILKAFEDAKPDAIKKAINHVIVKASYRIESVDSPLISAIRSGSIEMVEQVLSMGADVVVGLDEFTREYKAKLDKCYVSDNPEKEYQTNVLQPIVLAAKQEGMLSIVTKLLEKGADVNTLTEKSWQFVHNPSHGRYYWSEDKTVLDLIRDNRKKLEEYVREKDQNKPKKLKHPEPLESDNFYLENFTPGTYQHWHASKDLVTAKYIQAERAKKYQHDFDEAKKESQPITGRAEKKEAVSRLIQEFKAVEDDLIKKGAKSFYEIYPDLEKEPTVHNDEKSDDDKTDRQFKPKFRFRGNAVLPSKNGEYVELFEAAFRGDVDKVKTLCLPQHPDDSPLQVAARDGHGFSLFSIAVLRGFFDLAKVVLDIAAAQYVEKDSPRVHYSMPEDDSDDDENDTADRDDQKPRFYRTLVDDKFTIDNISAAQDIKSDVPPSELIQDVCEIWRIMDVDREEALRQFRVQGLLQLNPYTRKDSRKPWVLFEEIFAKELARGNFSLWTYAVATSNVKLLKFLLDQEVKYSNQEADEVLKALPDRTNELKFAMNLGHVEVMDTIIRNRGTLLPLHHLAQRSGVVIQETPKYYQGLSVHGQKRQDWAKQDEDSNQVDRSEKASPLLLAVLDGTLDVIDYFTSDTPERRYEEFAHSFKDDKRIRALMQADGGIRGSLKTWMKLRVNLILHMAVISWPAESNKRLQYLLSKVPKEYLEVRSANGETPLHLALRVRNFPAFETLLAAGADQRTRDKKGWNLLHTIYHEASSEKVNLFEKVVSMLDQNVVAELVLQKCSGTEPGLLTPLALYLANRPDETIKGLNILEAMLETSGSKDLTVMNGAGDYVLHSEVRSQRYYIAEYFATKKPDLLFLENATGMTPIQVAETQYLQNWLNHPPDVHSGSKGTSILDTPSEEFSTEKKTAPEKGIDTKIDDDIPDFHSTYALVSQIARNNPQARKLVSVLDANEVARRLAGQQHRKNAENRRREARGLKARWNRYYSRNPEDSDDEDGNSGSGKKNDEVSENRDASGSRRYTSLMWLGHVEDRMEDVEAGLQRFRDFADGKIEVLQCCGFASSENQYIKQGHGLMTSEIEGYHFREL